MRQQIAEARAPSELLDLKCKRQTSCVLSHGQSRTTPARFRVAARGSKGLPQPAPRHPGTLHASTRAPSVSRPTIDVGPKCLQTPHPHPTSQQPISAKVRRTTASPIPTHPPQHTRAPAKTALATKRRLHWNFCTPRDLAPHNFSIAQL